jgi:hypothetical protein
VQLDHEDRRVGEWLGRDWAVGFFSAIQGDETWKHLLEDPAHWPMVAPVLVFFLGHEVEQPEYNLDDDPEALTRMVQALYRISAYWRSYHQAMTAGQRAR